MTLPVYDSAGKASGKISINSLIFDGEVNISLLHQAVIMYQANKRKGTASTKTRAEVRGGGKKPWQQKGTGRARHGSIRSPIWRGGGRVFGPRPRDFSYTLPQKLRSEALRSAINARLKESQIKIVEVINIKTQKTKEIADFLSNFRQALPDGRQGRQERNNILLVLEEKNPQIILASRNIGNLDIKNQKDLCAYDCMLSDEIIFTKKAFELLEKRLHR